MPLDSDEFTVYVLHTHNYQLQQMNPSMQLWDEKKNGAIH